MPANEELPPPSYSEATGSSSTTNRPSRTTAAPSGLRIPTSVRRSMEDEARPVPEGWVRQYDAASSHQFFVDTRCDPPRSIWHHPYDDDTYLSTLSSSERERVEEQKRQTHQHLDDHTTDEEADSPSSSKRTSKPDPKRLSSSSANAKASSSSSAAAGSSSSSSSQQPSGVKKHARNLKDKLTGTTHEQREQRRREQAERDRKAMEMHQRVRVAMNRALETGVPQPIGRDRDGHELYIEPPNMGGGGMYGGMGGMGGMYGGSYGRQTGGQGWHRPPGYQGVNPYSSGPYANPNARFIRPQQPYSRPMYGGGLGMPIAGGLAGGLLLGGLIGGF